MSFKSNGKVAASYRPSIDTVSLLRMADAEKHLLHELTHAATSAAIKKNSLATAQLRALMQRVRASGKIDSSLYGMTNEYEFIAEAFSNPAFQEALQAVPIEGRSRIANAWQAFVDLVRRVLKLNDSTALDEAIRIGTSLIDETRQLRAAGISQRLDADVMLSRENAPNPFAPDAGEASRYRADLDRTMASLRSFVPPIQIGRTPAVLRALGAKDLPIAISRDVVRKATNGVKHVVSMDVMKLLPEELADPIAVFRSATHADSLVVLTEQKDAAGNPVVAAVDLRAIGERYEVNRIASVYGKDGKNPFAGWAEQGLLAYASERSSELVRLNRLYMRGSGSPTRSEKTVRSTAGLDGLQLPNRIPAQSSERGQKVLTENDVRSMGLSEGGLDDQVLNDITLDSIRQGVADRLVSQKSLTSGTAPSARSTRRRCRTRTSSACSRSGSASFRTRRSSR